MAEGNSCELVAHHDYEDPFWYPILQLHTILNACEILCWKKKSSISMDIFFWKISIDKIQVLLDGKMHGMMNG